MSATLTTRFVVHRITKVRRRNGTSITYFLDSAQPPVPEEENAVDDLLWEIADAACPQEFFFMQTTVDQPGSRGTEGIEIAQADGDAVFAVGDVVDISVRVVGRRTESGEPR